MSLGLTQIHESLPPLRGIVHAAGVLDDGPLVQQEWDRFAEVMAPKVQGAWELHAATEDLPLDFFVLFSSVASLLGSAGQGNYAAANAFLDGLAHYRRAQGLQALSINWGPWAEVGMAAALEERTRQRQTERGFHFIEPTQGTRALGEVLERSYPQLAVLPLDWPRYLESLGWRQPETLFRNRGS